MTAQDTTPTAAPRKPRHLAGEAAREWRRVVRLLTEADRIAETDLAVLTAYCATWQRWVFADETMPIETHRLFEDSERGGPRKSGEFMIWKDLSALLADLSGALALHVNARVRLPAAAKKQAADPFEELMRGSKRSG